MEREWRSSKGIKSPSHLPPLRGLTLQLLDNDTSPTNASLETLSQYLFDVCGAWVWPSSLSNGGPAWSPYLTIFDLKWFTTSTLFFLYKRIWKLPIIQRSDTFVDVFIVKVPQRFPSTAWTCSPYQWQVWLRGLAHFSGETCTCKRSMVKKLCKASCVQGVLRVQVCSRLFKPRNGARFWTLSGVLHDAPSICQPHSSLWSSPSTSIFFMQFHIIWDVSIYQCIHIAPGAILKFPIAPIAFRLHYQT